MIVAGPGPAREHHDFPSEDALQGFQVALADRLASTGWLLRGVNRERRTGLDRQRSGPAAGDRRSGAAGTGSPR